MQAFIDAVIELATLQAPPSVYLVHLAMIAYALGMLCRAQLPLRLFILSGTAFYIAYYYLYPAQPLWDAIFASLVIAAANVIGLVMLTADQFPIFMGKSGAVLQAMELISPGTIRPGEVKRLMRGVEIDVVDEPLIATRNGVRPDHLILLLSGAARIRKGNTFHALPAPCFVGEIAFITDGPASADVVVEPGSRCVRWPHAMVTRRMVGNVAIDRAVRALISYDLANKLARSVPTALDGAASIDRTAAISEMTG